MCIPNKKYWCHQKYHENDFKFLDSMFPNSCNTIISIYTVNDVLSMIKCTINKIDWNFNFCSFYRTSCSLRTTQRRMIKWWVVKCGYHWDGVIYCHIICITIQLVYLMIYIITPTSCQSRIVVWINVLACYCSNCFIYQHTSL